MSLPRVSTLRTQSPSPSSGTRRGDSPAAPAGARPSEVVQLPPSQGRRGRDKVEPLGRPDSARPRAEQGAAGRAGSCRGAAGADSAGSGGTRTGGPTLLSSSPCEAPGRPVSNRGRTTTTQPAGFGERLPIPEAGLAVAPASRNRRGRSPVWLPCPAPLHALSADPQRPGAQPRARPPPGPALLSRSESPGFPSRRDTCSAGPAVGEAGGGDPTSEHLCHDRSCRLLPSAPLSPQPQLTPTEQDDAGLRDLSSTAGSAKGGCPRAAPEPPQSRPRTAPRRAETRVTLHVCLDPTRAAPDSCLQPRQTLERTGAWLYSAHTAAGQKGPSFFLFKSSLHPAWGSGSGPRDLESQASRTEPAGRPGQKALGREFSLHLCGLPSCVSLFKSQLLALLILSIAYSTDFLKSYFNFLYGFTYI